MIINMSILLTRNETESDKEWIGSAFKNRHEIKLYLWNKTLNNEIVYMKNFKEHSSRLNIIEHDQMYKNYLMRACNNLNVSYPNDKDITFKRDYYLIKDADSLYFNGYFDITSKSRLEIKGREAWIVEMFVNKIIEKFKNSLMPVYMFSEDLKIWCQLNDSLKWIHILRPPTPIGKYVAFGTDPLSYIAKLEINNL